MNKKLLLSSLCMPAYGFLAGAVNWTVLYIIYETQLSFDRRMDWGSISIDFVGFPIEFLRYSLAFMFIATMIVIIVRYCLSKSQDHFLGWLVAGAVSVTVINLIVLSSDIDLLPQTLGFGWVCCIDNTSGYLVWLITLSVTIVYTYLFISVKRIVLGADRHD